MRLDDAWHQCSARAIDDCCIVSCDGRSRDLLDDVGFDQHVRSLNECFAFAVEHVDVREEDLIAVLATVMRLTFGIDRGVQALVGSEFCLVIGLSPDGRTPHCTSSLDLLTDCSLWQSPIAPDCQGLGCRRSPPSAAKLTMPRRLPAR